MAVASKDIEILWSRYQSEGVSKGASAQSKGRTKDEDENDYIEREGKAPEPEAEKIRHGLTKGSRASLA